MKKLLPIIIFIAIVTTSSTVCAKTMQFADKTYKLKFATNNSLNKGYINEYILNKETIAKWTQMISIHTFPDFKDPIDYVKNLAAHLHKKYKIKPYILANKKENLGVISFILPGKNKEKKSFIEYNLWKFKSDESYGVIGLQYAERYYLKKDSNVKIIVEKISKKHPELVNEIIKMPYPKIHKKNLQLK